MTIGAIKLTSQRTTALRLEDGLLHVDAFEWRGPESTIVASGSVGIADGVEGRLHLDGSASHGVAQPAWCRHASVDDRRSTSKCRARRARASCRARSAIEDGSMVVQPWRLAMADWSGTRGARRDRHRRAGTARTVQRRRGHDRGAPSRRARRRGRRTPLTITVRSAFLDAAPRPSQPARRRPLVEPRRERCPAVGQRHRHGTDLSRTGDRAGAHRLGADRSIGRLAHGTARGAGRHRRSTCASARSARSP